MGKQLKGLLYFYITNYRYSQMIFWSILFGTLILGLSFSYFLLSVNDGEFYFGFTVPMYVYCAVIGFIMVKDVIPFALKIGATRKNIYLSIFLFSIIFTFAMAVMANTLQSAVYQFTKLTGISNFEILHFVSFLESNNWTLRVVIDSSIMLLSFTIMFVFGLLFYRTGLAGGGIVSGILAIILLLGIAQGWIIEFVMEVFQTLDISFFYSLFGISIVIYCITFVFIRRITILKTK